MKTIHIKQSTKRTYYSTYIFVVMVCALTGTTNDNADLALYWSAAVKVRRNCDILVV